MSGHDALPHLNSYSHNSVQRDNDAISSSIPASVPVHNPSNEKIERLDRESLSSKPPVETVKQGFFPLTLALTLGWVIYIGFLLYLFEASVRKGLEDPYLPWLYTVAPGLLFTVFAQAHAAVTGMHLARIAISALGSPHTSPNQWIELFWIADRLWASPVGVLRTCATAFRKWIRPSLMFFLFALTCIIAIATPTVLNRAYPTHSVEVFYDDEISLVTFDPGRMSNIDAFLEESVGMGSWVTGQPMSQLYNASVFLPDGARWDAQRDASDFFFAGDIGEAEVVLPGIRFQGGCTPVDDGPNTANTTLVAAITPFCPDSESMGMSPVNATLDFDGFILEYALCSQLAYDGLRAEATLNEGYFLYSYSTTDTADHRAGNGFIHCTSTFTTGNAMLRSTNTSRTFEDFEYVKFFDPAKSTARGRDALGDPLGVAFDYLGYFAASAEVTIKAASKGFSMFMEPGEGENWTSPTPDDVADRLWNALAHNVAAIGSLSSSGDHSYNATGSTFAAVRVRQMPFVAIAYALLGSWLLLMVVVTAVGWRRTFASSLNTYVAAEFVAKHKPELFERARSRADGNSQLIDDFDVLFQGQ
ncbi:hypothetical protein EXIGLDRAFT_837694 [Exidia glandulosa HHB12029]|uniref:Uncharacterized protein n=1 Tax=Exidia glandulosa HHB12029 TaxID=1314781 RepID=A0A165GJK3_EXIGL|nr:hypothetical protein EXIGLDRAFT_837694 [Exidia glandulosa HHB12029]